MGKLIRVTIGITLMSILFTGCSFKADKRLTDKSKMQNEYEESREKSKGDVLVNYMSDTERESVKISIGDIALFDTPWDDVNQDIFFDEKLVEVGKTSDYVKYYEGEKNACIFRDNFEMIQYFDEIISSSCGEDVFIVGNASNNGNIINSSDCSFYDMENVELSENTEKLGEYKVVPCGYITNRKLQYDLSGSGNRKWDFDREKLEKIKGNITEIHLTDDETDMDFVCHIITPPGYDKDKKYPVLFMTDAVWRMDLVYSLWQEMEQGNSDKYIIATLGFDYKFDNTSQPLREYYFISHANLLDDFITDNLMPLLTEMYKIDCGNSTFFGHSNAGFLSYYCLMSSDLYDNQPFGNYLIGSPTLWSLSPGYGYGEVLKDYGYWDRNATMNKNVVICVGELEDKEYEMYFGDKPSTTEGAKLLNDRIMAHDVESEYIVYEGSKHSDYVDKMLLDYVKKWNFEM